MLLLKLKFRTICYLLHKSSFAVSTYFKSLDDYCAMENLVVSKIYFGRLQIPKVRMMYLLTLSWLV